MLGILGAAILGIEVERGVAEQSEADDFDLWSVGGHSWKPSRSETDEIEFSISRPVDGGMDGRGSWTMRPDASLWDGAGGTSAWSWHVLPDGLLFQTYLAGLKESRFSTAWLFDSVRDEWYWDSTLGGRVGILRYGTPGGLHPEGFQLDLEGAAMPRLDVQNQDDLESVDFRFATPFSWSEGPYSVRFGYYHISSHLGDEYLVRNPDAKRLNYVRDGLLLGFSLNVNDDVRVYSEAGWAFSADGGARPWEFQFGSEYRPADANQFRPTPYAAVNGHLRQELGFGGNVNIMAGWQWRSFTSDRLFRFGLQHINGRSAQYSFYHRYERLTGIGFWFDY